MRYDCYGQHPGLSLTTPILQAPRHCRPCRDGTYNWTGAWWEPVHIWNRRSSPIRLDVIWIDSGRDVGGAIASGPKFAIDMIEGQYRFRVGREAWSSGLTFDQAVVRFARTDADS